VPVLAGFAGYAIGGLRDWSTGLERRPTEAKAFYGVIAAAVILGLAVDYVGVDPMRALFWSAVVNGVTSVPLMAALMVVAGRRRRRLGVLSEIKAAASPISTVEVSPISGDLHVDPDDPLPGHGSRWLRRVHVRHRLRGHHQPPG
jgi:Mn2+/Fe2+ NRAMP family transporter